MYSYKISNTLFVLSVFQHTLANINLIFMLQAVLEFMYPDERFHVRNDDREYDIFGHGGMLFLFTSSVFFFVVSQIIHQFGGWYHITTASWRN